MAGIRKRGRLEDRLWLENKTVKYKWNAYNWLAYKRHERKRQLRQKATVSLQNTTENDRHGCGELMMLTYQWWMQILIPDLRCDDHKFHWECTWKSSFWLEWNGLRMLSKAWHKVLERGVKITVQYHAMPVSYTHLTLPTKA